jgi:hypothetical protein
LLHRRLPHRLRIGGGIGWRGRRRIWSLCLPDCVRLQLRPDFGEFRFLIGGELRQRPHPGSPQISQKPQDHTGSGQYFANAVEELIRAAVIVLSNAGEPISILTIHRVICSLPTYKEQIEEEAWQTTVCGRLILSLRDRKDSFTPSQWDDLEVAIGYLMEKWPEHDPRTRSNIESTWSGMASKFVYDPVRSMFCGGRVDFTPEQTTHQHLVVIIDMPTLEYGKAASKLCQVGMKMVFQKAWLRHPYVPGCCHGAFLFQDEFAHVMSRDESFHMVCRGSAIAPVCILPNILNMAAEEFGEQTPGSRTLGFLGLLSIRIWHANSETRTNEWCADQIGKEFRHMSGWNAGNSESGGHTGISGSMQHQYILEPHEFTKLVKPDGENPFSEAIVYVSGRTFAASRTAARPEGASYLRVFFSRE